MRDYYAVLGVRATATSREIRRAYQRLARQYSPDVNVWDDRAGALFAEVSEAYRVLSDASARSVYDRYEPRAGDEGAPRGRRGDDLTVPVALSFLQAVTGLNVDLSVARLGPCGACAATGARPGAATVPCPHCDGLGTVWTGGLVPRPQPCRLCEGAGVSVPDPCAACGGRGAVPEQAVLRVAVPAGVDTGTEVRVPGQGHSGPVGGPRGDLVLIARVHDHPGFTRKGDNLHCEVPVGLAEAVLGARVAVRGPDDGWLDLEIPAGTQGGQVFRLRGKGMPRLAGGRGDLYVAVRVEIPAAVDARTRAALAELAAALPAPPRRREPRAVP